MKKKLVWVTFWTVLIMGTVVAQAGACGGWRHWPCQ